MKFLVGPKANFTTTTASIIIQEGADTIFHLKISSEQDNIDGWYNLFNYLRKTQPQELKGLLDAIPQLLQIGVDEDAHDTYLNMLYALFNWTEKEKKESQEQVSIEDNILNLYSLHQQLKHALFNFEVVLSTNSVYYVAVFPYPGQETFPVYIPINKFDKAPVQTSQVMLKKAYERNPQYIEYFINNYSHFQEYVISADQRTFNVFNGISKALVKLIKQENTSLGIYVSLVPDICTFIVRKERDNEEQKEYLEPILRSFESVEQKLERLNGIISEIKNEITPVWIPHQANVRHFEEDGHTRLMHLISLISADYLRLYDLESSARFWHNARSKDPVLWFFLLLHRKPYLYLLLQLALLIPPSVYAFQHWLTGQPCPLILGTPGPALGKVCPPVLDSYGAEFIILLTGLILYVFLVLLLLFIFTQIMRKRWLYSQLLLPRILGAAIVGLLPLLLNDQSWNIGVLSNVFNWGLLALLTYIFSFIYVFIEVHNIKKFIKGHSIAQVLRESARIYLIALSETLFFVTITSSLIFPAVISNIGSNIVNYRFGIYTSIPLLSFGFFPSLIILWTGIALFIGSFVQLIWQDQRITESI